MREKLNSDPKAQIAMIAILVLVAGFFFITKMGGGEEEEVATTEATVAIAGTGESGTATGTTPGEAVENAVEQATASASTSAAVSSAIVPQNDRGATAAGRRCARPTGPTRRSSCSSCATTGSTTSWSSSRRSTLSSVGDVALFVVPVSQIFRYAAITVGAEVSRVPALVVMRPRTLSDGTPQAAVSYGFQTRPDDPPGRPRRLLRGSGRHLRAELRDHEHP